jgi:beta-glucanase (GH16 family)
MERGWHTYAVEWEPNVLRWYIDGKQVSAFHRCRPGQLPRRDPYNACGPITGKRMYLVLNFAVGNGQQKWVGTVTKKTHFPSTVLVDYVRVWTR